MKVSSKLASPKTSSLIIESLLGGLVLVPFGIIYASFSHFGFDHWSVLVVLLTVGVFVADRTMASYRSKTRLQIALEELQTAGFYSQRVRTVFSRTPTLVSIATVSYMCLVPPNSSFLQDSQKITTTGITQIINE
jgi:hypothetical protein